MKTGLYDAVLPFLRPLRWRLLALALATAVVSVLAMLPPIVIRAILDDVVAAGQRERLTLLAALLVVVPVLHALFGFVQSTGLAYVGQKFVMTLRGALYAHLLGLSMRFFGRESAGKLVNRLMGDSANVQNLLTAQALQVVSDLVCATFAVATAFALNWRLALLLLGILAFFVINYRLNAGQMRTATQGYRGAEDRLSGDLQNRLAANLTVKTFGMERREHGTFQAQSVAALDLVESSQFAVTSFTMNTVLLRDLGRAVIYFAGCALVLRDGASYGDVVAFTAYATQLLMPAVRFSELAQHFQDVSVSLERIIELFDAKPEVTSRAPARALPAPRGQVDFEDVTFGYTPGEPILRRFTLNVKPGETVALVGPTGCGKTTLLALLMRFFDVESGRILVDGVDVRDRALLELRRLFGLVLQEPLLFGVSVADNIRYSRQGASREEIVAAAKVAEIHTTIEALSHGYDSMVGGRGGVRLSVGQKQRISIARAVLANPAILIMDEATSSLDTESERAIQHAMGRFLRNRTAFVVAHRLSTIRSADRIVMLGGGAIREMGTHDELMRLNAGRYREMYLKHMGKGILTEE